MREARDGKPKRRAHRYDTIEEAQADGNVSVEEAQARIDAQDIASKIRKEADK